MSCLPGTRSAPKQPWALQALPALPGWAEVGNGDVSSCICCWSLPACVEAYCPTPRDGNSVRAAVGAPAARGWAALLPQQHWEAEHRLGSYLLPRSSRTSHVKPLLPEHQSGCLGIVWRAEQDEAALAATEQPFWYRNRARHSCWAFLI